jgi:hypothetical protein
VQVIMAAADTVAARRRNLVIPISSLGPPPWRDREEKHIESLKFQKCQIILNV